MIEKCEFSWSKKFNKYYIDNYVSFKELKSIILISRFCQAIYIYIALLVIRNKFVVNISYEVNQVYFIFIFISSILRYIEHSTHIWFEIHIWYIYIYKDKDKINLVYFIRFIHYKLVSYDKQCLPHSSGEFKCRAMLLPRLYILYIYMFDVNGMFKY
jgi:hypothetical protein